jgi:phosphoribosylaminoimidazole (AIR) synthetase
MRRVFNLGIGMVLIVPAEKKEEVEHSLNCHGESDHLVIGTIKKADPQKEKVIFTF